MRKNVNRYVVESVIDGKDITAISTICHCESLYVAELVTYSLNASNPFKIDLVECLNYRFRKIAKDFIPDTDDFHFSPADFSPDDFHFSPADFSPADCTEMIKSLNE